LPLRTVTAAPPAAARAAAPPDTLVPVITPTPDGATVPAFGWLEATTIVVAATWVAPCSSSTSTLTSLVPGSVNVCVATGPVALPPSPKDQRWATTVPSGSDEDDASTVTVSGAPPFAGVTVSPATGGRLALPPSRWLSAGPFPVGTA